MSLIAVVFFLLSAVCVLTGASIEVVGGWDVALKIGAVIFGLLFFCSLLVGKRIKFDPVLR